MKILHGFILLLILAGCAVQAPLDLADIPDSTDTLLRKEFENWKGTPHCMGGCTPKCTDCSCFVKQIYARVFNLKTLPRTVRHMAEMQQGTLIYSRAQLYPGDLVIFEQPRPWYKYHVGIYLSNGEFMHASKSKGVQISRIDDPYHWKKYFRKARRLLNH